jgi:DNA-binding protein
MTTSWIRGAVHDFPAWLRRALVAASLLALAACGSGGDLGPDPGIAPAITTQPASLTAEDQSSATFSVTATGADLTYQWQRDGADIAGATLAVYTTAELTLADTGAVFSVLISNGAGSIASDPATLTVVAAPPRFSAQPADTSVLDDDRATFGATITGTGPFTYQWYRNGAAIGGATSATYTTPATDPSDSGTVYRLVVNGRGGSGTSEDATLTVRPRPPTVTAQPTSTVTTNGGSASFSAAASGTAPFTYQWYRNGVAISGATSAAFTLTGANYGDDQGRYTVVVSNGGGDTSSQPAILTVTPNGAIQTISACGDIGSAGAYRLSASLSGGAPGAACITISGASNVQLDCAGRSVTAAVDNASAIDVVQSQNVSVKNCTIVSERMTLDRVTNVSIGANTFQVPSGGDQTSVSAVRSVRLSFVGNTIATGAFSQTYGQSVGIVGNTITAKAGTSAVPGAVISSFGRGTRVVGNTLTASWDSSRGNLVQNGAQAAIAISDESDVAIDNNTMRDMFTCGVELVGTISGVVARSNSVVNAGQCGFGGNLWLSVSNGRFVANTVDRSAAAFQFYRALGLRPAGTDPDGDLAADTAVVFRDVTFERNRLTTPLASDGTANPPSVTIVPLASPTDGSLPLAYDGNAGAGNSALTAAMFQLGNVRFIGNDFGRAASPIEFGDGTLASGIVIDGGSNVCPVSTAPVYPIACQ